MKKLATAAALIAALALAGCSAGESPTEATPAPTTAASAPSSDANRSKRPTAETAANLRPAADASLQERADKAMAQFLESYGRTDFKQFSDGTPHQMIKEWYFEADGETLVIIVDNQANRFQWLAADFLERTHESNGIESVTVLNESNWGSTKTLEDLDAAA